eukprot:Amastigsp_a841560_178.p1 type:complete len:172 gc:universal Amastigsp_a841560_178:601-86(-)
MGTRLFSAAAMFYELSRQHEVRLLPRDFGPMLRERINSKLLDEVEGTVSGSHGFVITVTDISPASMGKVSEDTGEVTYLVPYKAIYFCVSVGEIIDVVVETVNSLGIFAVAGPMSVIVPESTLKDDYVFETPFWKSNDQSRTIKVNDELRVRVKTMVVDPTSMKAIASIVE